MGGRAKKKEKGFALRAEWIAPEGEKPTKPCINDNKRSQNPSRPEPRTGTAPRLRGNIATIAMERKKARGATGERERTEEGKEACVRAGEGDRSAEKKTDSLAVIRKRGNQKGAARQDMLKDDHHL